MELAGWKVLVWFCLEEAKERIVEDGAFTPFAAVEDGAGNASIVGHVAARSDDPDDPSHRETVTERLAGVVRSNAVLVDVATAALCYDAFVTNHAVGPTAAVVIDAEKPSGEVVSFQASYTPDAGGPFEYGRVAAVEDRQALVFI